jgi:ankyrin repeat protein
MTPLHQVVEGTFISEEGSGVVQLLLGRGADVNKPDGGHNTPLHLASLRQHLKSVQVLLNHGANVNAEDLGGWTPLDRALDGRFLSGDGLGVVQLLVEHGADVNTKKMDHLTPLHFASSYPPKLESVPCFLTVARMSMRWRARD